MQIFSGPKCIRKLLSWSNRQYAKKRRWHTSIETKSMSCKSGKDLGAVLLQDKKPIAYASKSLTDAEKRYANIERELLAERFHSYVYRKEFTVESDHEPLEMIQLKNLTAAPPRLQRMLLGIQHYYNTTTTLLQHYYNTTTTRSSTEQAKSYFSQMAYRDFQIREVNKKAISTSLSGKGKPAKTQYCVTCAKSS